MNINDSNELTVKPVLDIETVATLPRRLQLTDDPENVAYVLDQIGVNPDDHDYRAVFVDTENDDYTEVWAIRGIIPLMASTAHRLL